MSFPSKLYFKTIDTGEEVYCGGYTVSQYTELTHIIAVLFKKGTASGNMRLNVYGDSGRSEVLMSSDWVDLTTIPDFSAGNWVGRVRFDFANLNLSPNHEVYITAETSSYTRASDTHYLALSMDWPIDIYGAGEHVQLEMYGYE